MSDIIREALDDVNANRYGSDGKWLEQLTVKVAPYINDWDVIEAWRWQDWPNLQNHYSDKTDIGIDLVAQRSDGQFIAIQCKSRKLDEQGQGKPITKNEFDSFVATSSDQLWAERWLVVNGNVSLGKNANATAGQKPVKPVNIETDLRSQLEGEMASKLDPCPHCAGGRKQTRDCMQREAIENSIYLLQQNANANNSDSARGRIILPCGTGKSRIALRIIEELTVEGQVSVVLCPSIALVAQLRREFLVVARRNLKVMAVCSDQTAALGSDLNTDPTVDLGHTSAAEVKGFVTTDSVKIGEWIDDVAKENDRIGVIFGTYQSSHKIATALTGRRVQVMVADEAHRTSSLRRISQDEQKLRDFTVCHDNGRFPAKFRVYQTATPRVYSTDSKGQVMKDDGWIVRDMADEDIFGTELYRKSYAEAVANGWLTDYRIIAIGVNDKDAYETANRLAADGNKKLSTAHFLKGLVLALVMGGALRPKGVEIRSSINFMNLIARSKEMATALQSLTVRNWLKRRLEAGGGSISRL